MADPDLELGGGVVSLTLPAFLPSVISYFTQNKWGWAPPGPPRSAADLSSSFLLRTEGTRFLKTLTLLIVSHDYRDAIVFERSVYKMFSFHVKTINLRQCADLPKKNMKTQLYFSS